jgi:hypothetical protein
MKKYIAALFALFCFDAHAQYNANIMAITPSNVLTVDTAGEVATARADLVQDIFKQPSLPTDLPTFGSNYSDPFWNSKPNMGSIRRMHVDAGYGMDSEIWNFQPVNYRADTTGKCGFIVHAGHSQQSVKAPFQAMVIKLVEIGCEVYAIDMPLAGVNLTSANITTPHGVFGTGVYHDNLRMFRARTFNPMQFFIKPPVVAVNDFIDRGITNIGMFGLSGGGWTTDVTAAVDDRIDLSYSLAGSMPMYMRPWVSGSVGDWEQHTGVPELDYDYLDLYVLGAVGTDRHKANLYIVNDSCCFGGYNANHFAPTVAAAVTAIGTGTHSVAFDTSVSSHTVSTWTINWVTNDITTRIP